MAYFANSTEGEVLERQCAECPYGEEPCPVALVQLTYNYDQNQNKELEQAMEILVDEEGICQMKLLLDVPVSEANRKCWAIKSPSGVIRWGTVDGASKEDCILGFMADEGHGMQGLSLPDLKAVWEKRYEQKGYSCVSVIAREG